MRKQTSKTTRKKATAKKAPAKKATAGKAVAKKTTAKKTAAKKTTAKKTTTTKKAKRPAVRVKKAPVRKNTAVKAQPDFPMNYAELRKAVLVLRALNHGFRQKLMNLLHKKGTASVSEIHKALRVEQSVASQHLGVLRREGIVERERQGKFIYYSLNYDRLKELAFMVEQITKD